MENRRSPHFLRFARALTLTSGLALTTTGCGPAGDAALPFPGVKVMNPDAGDAAQVPFPGVKVMNPDAGDAAQVPFPGVKIMNSDAGDAAQVPFPGVKILNPDAQ